MPHTHLQLDLAWIACRTVVSGGGAGTGVRHARGARNGRVSFAVAGRYHPETDWLAARRPKESKLSAQPVQDYWLTVHYWLRKQQSFLRRMKS